MRQLIRGTPRDSSGGHSDAPHRAFTPARARSRSQTQHGLPRAPRARTRADAPVGNGRRGEHMHTRQGPPWRGSRRRADARSSRRNQRSLEVIRGHQRSSRGHQRSSEVIRGHQTHARPAARVVQMRRVIRREEQRPLRAPQLMQQVVKVVKVQSVLHRAPTQPKIRHREFGTW